jgi:hypothetical protein
LDRLIGSFLKLNKIMEGSMNFRTMSKVVKGLFVASLLSFSVQGMAASIDGFSTVVTSVLIQGDSTFGGCMISVSNNPASKIPATCGAYYLSMNCAGLNGGDAVRSYRMLDQAQLALATGRGVYVEFSDDFVYNGYCRVTRLDLR